jgi:hypothetical protein
VKDSFGPPPTATSPRTPGTIIAARVVGWIQVGLLCLAAAILGVLALTVRSVSRDIDAGVVHGLAAAAIGMLAINVLMCVGLAVAIVVPIARLRAGRIGAGVGLIVIEAVTAVYCVLALAVLPGLALRLAAAIGLTMTLAVIICVCAQASMAWLRNESGATANRGQWATDPFRRYELRYHDGAQWTSSVSSGGHAFVDHPSHV